MSQETGQLFHCPAKKKLGGKEKAPRRKKLYYESRHVGETQFSHREERLILAQGRRLVL